MPSNDKAQWRWTMDLGLAGRTVFISGATQGIGLGIAERLAGEGADLFITARDPERLQATADGLAGRHGIRCEWISTDFSVPGQATRAALAALDAFPIIDILVNNAGRSLPLDIDAPTEQWQHGFQLNFLSHLEVIRTLTPSMRHRGWGRVVNVMGIAFRAPRRLSAGTPAKYALWATSKALVDDLVRDGVTINAVSVGKVESHQMNGIYYPDADSIQELADAIPARRLGRPDEVGDVVAFLASDRASYMTGSVVTIDGGLNRFIA